MKTKVHYLILIAVIFLIVIFLNNDNKADLMASKGKYLPLMKCLYLLGMAIGISGAFKVFKKLRNTN